MPCDKRPGRIAVWPGSVEVSAWAKAGKRTPVTASTPQHACHLPHPGKLPNLSPMANKLKLTTKGKALELNLNPKIYGTIAEIGGGQEVAAHFFKAGAASGTIAKTMSAYDMIYSDAIYGKAKRYVSEDKLNKMVSKEYDLLSQRLIQRARSSQFFSFANTVEILNFKKSNQGHGWIGVRFQRYPLSPHNDCVIHISLLDPDQTWQQEVLGILGVNLIFAVYNFSDPKDILLSLCDNLSMDRLEVDIFTIRGPDFPHVDNRLMSMLLVQHGLSRTSLFSSDSRVLLPSEALYKRDTIVLRGKFRPILNTHISMVIKGLRRFRKEPGVRLGDTVGLVEISLTDLFGDGEVDEANFLDIINCLSGLGAMILITNFKQHHKLAKYLSQLLHNHLLVLVCGWENLKEIFNRKHYQDLHGGLLEGLSRLFGGTKLYIYPTLKEPGVLYTLDDIEDLGIEEGDRHLYHHLVKTGCIELLKISPSESESIDAGRILRGIQDDTGSWEKHVPSRVVGLIKKMHMFDFPASILADEDKDLD